MTRFRNDRRVNVARQLASGVRELVPGARVESFERDSAVITAGHSRFADFRPGDEVEVFGSDGVRHQMTVTGVEIGLGGDTLNLSPPLFQWIGEAAALTELETTMGNVADEELAAHHALDLREKKTRMKRASRERKRNRKRLAKRQQREARSAAGRN